MTKAHVIVGRVAVNVANFARQSHVLGVALPLDNSARRIRVAAAAPATTAALCVVSCATHITKDKSKTLLALTPRLRGFVYP